MSAMSPETPALSRSVLKPCLNCRQRKVKCDKGNPCQGCVRFAKPCVYEDSTVPVKTVASPQQNILHSHSPVLQSTSAQSDVLANGYKPRSSALTSQTLEDGLLVVRDGLSMYVTPGYWAKLFEEGDELQLLFRPSSGVSSTNHWPSPATSLSDLAFSSPTDAIPDASPFASVEFTNLLCTMFFKHVEPFIRILHHDSFQRELKSFLLAQHPSALEFQALLMSISTLTIHLSSASTIEQATGESHVQVLQKFQAAAQLALQRCRVLSSRSLVCLQALLYYSTFQLEAGRAETVTSIIGIAYQLARRLGLHKDSQHPIMSPFTIDMRRRAWVHLVYLDLRCSELTGMDAMLQEDEIMSTTWPANVDNAEWEAWLHTRRAPPPQPSVGITDMTFIIIRCQLARALYLLLAKVSSLTAMETDSIVEIMRDELSKSLFLPLGTIPGLEDSTTCRPIQKFTEVYLRLEFEQMRLALDVSHVKYGRRSSDEHKNDTWHRAVHILEGLAHLERTSQGYGWSWVVASAPRFFAVATILCHRIHRQQHFTTSEWAQAWQESERVFNQYESSLIDVREECGSWIIIQYWRNLARCG